MKIISKHKDYYDYIVGTYDRDEKIVYDRRGDNEIHVYHKPSFYKSKYSPDDWSCMVFSICGGYFPIVVKNNGEEYRWLPEHMPKSVRVFNGTNNSELYAIKTFDRFYEKKSDLNTKYKQPVLLRSARGYGDPYVCIPILAEWGFPKIIPANDMYNKIYSWISWSIDNPPIPNTQTDKEKVAAHGFDAKKSFRPKMS